MWRRLRLAAARQSVRRAQSCRRAAESTAAHTATHTCTRQVTYIQLDTKLVTRLQLTHFITKLQLLVPQRWQ